MEDSKRTWCVINRIWRSSSAAAPDDQYLPIACHTANLFLLADMDFLEKIKLVNYVRSEVKAGNLNPDVSSKAKFDDEIYMKPVLEDDALLYSLEDVLEDDQSPDGPGGDAERRVLELQEDLERLQSQFSEYRTAVQKSMEEQLSKEDEDLSSSASAGAVKPKSRLEMSEWDYFSSYSYNGMSFY